MPDIDISELLGGRPATPRSRSDAGRPRIDGVTLGIVSDVDDPEFIGRIKVSLPWLSGIVDSAWARVAVPWAGQRRGSYFVPRVDDEVLVAFRHGDPQFPYVIGFLWNELNFPPEPTPRLDQSEIRSRNGHTITLDDFPATSKLQLTSALGHQVTVDDVQNKITLQDATSTLSVTVDAMQRQISITALAGNVSVSANAGKISLQAAAVDITASANVSIQAGGTVSVKGALVTIN